MDSKLWRNAASIISSYMGRNFPCGGVGLSAKKVPVSKQKTMANFHSIWCISADLSITIFFLILFLKKLHSGLQEFRVHFCIWWDVFLVLVQLIHLPSWIQLQSWLKFIYKDSIGFHVLFPEEFERTVFDDLISWDLRKGDAEKVADCCFGNSLVTLIEKYGWHDKLLRL